VDRRRFLGTALGACSIGAPPDLILMDIGLPSLSRIEAARRIRNLVPEAKVVFLSQESSSDVIQMALNTGASGYVVKANAETELLRTVQTAILGN
jgi:DNA-binding NarL/FixJ family response regulator